MKLKKFDELYSISPGNIPNQGIMFVDHSKQNRSGHLGHALIQCKNFDILAFYPDCSNAVSYTHLDVYKRQIYNHQFHTV